MVLSGSTSAGDAGGFGGVIEVGASFWRVLWWRVVVPLVSVVPTASGAATVVSGASAAGSLGAFVVLLSLDAASACFASRLSWFVGADAWSGPAAAVIAGFGSWAADS